MSTVQPRELLARVLLFAYPVYAAGLVGYLLLRPGQEAGLAFLVDAAIIATALAAAASLLLAIWFGHRSSRRWIIGLHLTLVPVQFVLSIPLGRVVLAGMVLSVVMAAVMGPRFPRLPPKPRRLFLTLHVGLSVSWLGLSLAMLTLGLVGVLTGDAGLRHHAYRLMHIFDLAIVIPVVLLSILSGLVVSLFSKWGLTRHWWVLTKFVISLAIPATAGAWHFWIADLIARTAADPMAAAGGLGMRLVVFLAGSLVLLSTATVLSVYKPAGRTPWARRPPARPAAPAGALR